MSTKFFRIAKNFGAWNLETRNAMRFWTGSDREACWDHFDAESLGLFLAWSWLDGCEIYGAFVENAVSYRPDSDKALLDVVNRAALACRDEVVRLQKVHGRFSVVGLVDANNHIQVRVVPPQR